MRSLALLALVAAFDAAIAMGPPVDLNNPGVLDALKIETPSRHAKIVAILDGVAKRPASDVGTWMRTQFDASNIEAAPLWHVSDPPRIRVTFTLDDTRYTAMVVGRFREIELAPARR